MRTLGDVLLHGYNDAALARAVGVAPSTIGRWRANEEMIPLGKALALARVQGYHIVLRREEREYVG